MYGQLLNRSGFADVLAGKRTSSGRLRELFSLRDIDIHLAKDQIAAIWPGEDAHDLPYLLMVDEDAQRDWIAWIVTYAPNIRPFTAYCRIVGQEAGRRLLAQERQANDSGLGTLGSAYLGLILGEVISWDDRASVLRRGAPIPSACMSTLAFALCRACAVYGRDFSLEGIASKWLDVQQLTRQRGRSTIPADRIVAIMGVLAQAQNRAFLNTVSNPDKPLAGIAAFCERIAGRDSPNVQDLSPLVQSPLAQLFAHMEGTREERVAIVERAIDMIVKHGRSNEEDCFALGFLASQIAPGQLSHTGVLIRVLPVCPTAMLWYGICTGLMANNKIQNEFSGVARRVLRELSIADAWPSRPFADIGWMELDVFLGSQRPPLEDFMVGWPSLMVVELIPRVSTTVAWAGGRAARSEPQTPIIKDPPQLQPTSVRDERLVRERDERLAREVEVTLERLMALWSQFAGERLRRSRPEQQSLFDGPDGPDDDLRPPDPGRSATRRRRRE